MFDYDKKQKIKSLDIWGFNVEELNIDKIEYVPMHQYRIVNDNESMLYVDNLQCCVGLYAYGDNFAFAAHINPMVMRGDEFALDNERRPIRCKRSDDLKNEILNNGISDVKVGLALGVAPLDKNHPTMKLIENGINSAIIELISCGIDVEKLEDIYAPEFIMDCGSGSFIFPKKNLKK